MKFMREKVSYLKGLAEGLNVDPNTSEGKLFKTIIGVLDDLALVVDDIVESQEEMSEQIDAIDEDLAEVENLIFDEEDECDCDCDCDDTCYTRVKCPRCNEEIEFDACLLEDGDTIQCPNCKEEIDIELECCCDDFHDEEEEDN